MAKVTILSAPTTKSKSSSGHRRAFSKLMRKKMGYGGMTASVPASHGGFDYDNTKSMNTNGDRKFAYGGRIPKYPDGGTPTQQEIDGAQNYADANTPDINQNDFSQDPYGTIQPKSYSSIPFQSNTQYPRASGYSTPTNYNLQDSIQPVGQAGAIGGNPNPTDWGKIANKVGQYAPAAYNLGMGLSKPTQLNPNQFQNPYQQRISQLLANRSINMNQVRNNINNSYRGALYESGKSQGSSGGYLSSRTALYGSRMNALGNADLVAQKANNSYRGEEAQGLSGLGAEAAKTNLGVTDWNEGSRMANRRYLGAAATDIGKASNANQLNPVYSSALEQMNNYRPKYDPNTGLLISNS